MSDLAKLEKLADQADELFMLKDTVDELRSEITSLKQQLEEKNHRVLSTDEAAKEMGVSRTAVYNWVKRGLIPAVYSSGGYKIPACRIFAIAEQQAMERHEKLIRAEAKRKATESTARI